jgi:hypothetical protein
MSTTAVSKIHPTKVACEQATPADAPKGTRAFLVLRGDAEVGWVAARIHAHAIEIVAKEHGYTATTGRTANLMPSAVRERLASLTTAQLAEMGLVRQPAPVPATPPSTPVQEAIAARPAATVVVPANAPSVPVAASASEQGGKKGTKKVA